MRVYLAGTISPKPEHLEWRQQAARFIEARLPHEALSPLRFQNPADFTGDGLHDASCPDSMFVANDIADLKRSDVVLLVFWKGATRQSIGTWAEFGIAALLHKPVIVVTDDPAVSGHPFIRRFAAVVVPTVDQGLDWLDKILT